MSFNLVLRYTYRGKTLIVLDTASAESTRQLGQHSFSHTVSVIEIVIQFLVTLVFLAS